MILKLILFKVEWDVFIRKILTINIIIKLIIKWTSMIMGIWKIKYGCLYATLKDLCTSIINPQANASGDILRYMIVLSRNMFAFCIIFLIKLSRLGKIRNSWEHNLEEHQASYISTNSTYINYIYFRGCFHWKYRIHKSLYNI